MNTHDYLILKKDEFSSRVDDFYKKLKTLPRFRQKFINNPTQVISQQLFDGLDLKDAAVSHSNRMMFALFSNPRFLDWAEDFQRNYEDKVQSEMRSSQGTGPHIAARRPNENEIRFNLLVDRVKERRELHLELAKAILEFSDPTVMSIALEPRTSAWPEPGGPGDPGPVLPAIFIVIAVVLVIFVFAATGSPLNRTDVQSIASQLAANSNTLRQNDNLVFRFGN